MLIPSIDLQGGKVVQLVQGKRKALEFDDPAEWIARFHKYPLVQLIDLDAAIGKGSNPALVASIAAQLPCQVGGGIRSVQSAVHMLALGARRVIVGSALFEQGAVNVAFAEQLADAVGAPQVVCAIDTRGGRIATHGWEQQVELTAADAMPLLEPFCSAFLYTHIDTEGTLQGFPMHKATQLRALTARQFIVAGGIRSQAEVDALHLSQVDAVVGMAIYTGLMDA